MVEASSYYPFDPVFCESRIMDEDNFHIIVSHLKQNEAVLEEIPLLEWEQIVSEIRTSIQNDELKSVYEIELGYTVAMNEQDMKAMLGDDSMAPEARYRLLPAWEIKGYAKTEDNRKRFDAVDPDYEQVMMDGFGMDYRNDTFRYRLNAQTGKPITYEDLICN